MASPGDERAIRSSRCAALGAGTLALGLLLSLVATPAPVSATPSVRVELLGLDGQLRANVLAALSIRDRRERRGATESYLRHLHARAEQEIRKALEPFGYYRPFIRAELETDGSWIARYDVRPGPPLILDSVRVEVRGEGADDPGYQKHVAEFPLHKGDILIQPAYDRGKAAFEVHAAESGFLDARFVSSRVQVDLERYTGSIDLVIDTGPKHFFGDAHFDQTVVDSTIAAKFVTFRRGEPFDYRKLLETQTGLSSTGWYERVEVQPGPESHGHREVPIEVTLTPSRKLRLTSGVGYGTDDGARARSLVEWRRINRQGHHAQLEGQLGQLDTNGGARYFVPWPNPRTDMATFSGGYQRLRSNVSRSEVFQGGVSLSRILALWSTTVGVSYRDETFTVGPDQGSGRFLVPEANWSHTRTEDRLYTRGGDRLRLNLRGAHRSLLSDATLFQQRTEGKWIYSLGKPLRALARFELGTTGTDAFRDLPPSMRFFAGGANSVRGYSYNSLGPTDAAGLVIGGRHLVTASVEGNWFFLERWGVAAFYDVGNAVNSLRDPLKRGPGVGLRWASPLGLVRGDVGWGLDRRNRAAEFHLTLGPEL